MILLLALLPLSIAAYVALDWLDDPSQRTFAIILGLGALLQGALT